MRPSKRNDLDATHQQLNGAWYLVGLVNSILQHFMSGVGIGKGVMEILGTMTGESIADEWAGGGTKDVLAEDDNTRRQRVPWLPCPALPTHPKRSWPP